MQTKASRVARVIMLLVLAIASAGCDVVLAMEAGHHIVGIGARS